MVADGYNRRVKCFVTGASGFVGANLVHELNARGHEVRALVRDADKLDRMLVMHGIDGSSGVGEGSIEVVVGDMIDADAVTNALKGCDACVHTAAFTSLDPEQMHHALEVNAPGPSTSWTPRRRLAATPSSTCRRCR